MSCIACLACQGLCSGASCIISCCGKTSAPHTGVRVIYFLFFLVTSVAAWALSAFGRKLPYLGDRLGPLSAYNLTFGFVVFHFLFALICIKVSDARSARGQLHNGWWGPKFLVWLALLVGFLFLPTGFLTVYPYISLVGSIVFTVIQLFMLIDFAHAWNESWVDKFHATGHKLWYWLLLSASILFMLLTLVGVILMYAFFAQGGEDCPYNSLTIALISANLGLVAICIVLSILPAVQNVNPRASLFTAAIISIYSTYLVGSAIFSLPIATDPHGLTLCHYQIPTHNEALKYVTLVAGALITFVAVAFSSMSAGSHAGTVEGPADEKTLLVRQRDGDSEEQERLLEAHRRAKMDVNGDGDGDEDEELRRQRELEKADRELLNLDDRHDHHHDGHHPHPVAYNYTWFHSVMLLGAMYIGSLMSNWAVVDHVVPTGIVVDKSIVSVWLKAASGWVVSALYVWTLLAPAILRNRDFGYNN